MHYGLFSSDFLRTYKDRYVEPYWYYTVVPRNYNQPVYETILDFSEPPFDAIEWYYNASNGDILELFILDNRVLVTGVTVAVEIPSEVQIEIISRSKIPFGQIDCSEAGQITLTPFGGVLGRTTNLQEHSFVVEEPDYIGIKLVSGAENLAALRLKVTALVDDLFTPQAKTNSSKVENADG